MLHPNDRQYDRKEPEDPVSSMEYLKQILDRYHIDPENPVRQICTHWQEIAGPSVGSISKCIGMTDGKLNVICSHPAQVQLLKMNKREILKSINAVFPELKVLDINISVSKH